MGTSKIILLSGVYLILGLYTVSFTSADGRNFSQALEVSSTLQSEQLAQAGMSLALVQLGSNASATSLPTKHYTMLGGEVSVSADRPASLPLSQIQVVSQGQFNGERVQMTAVFYYHEGRWKLLRVTSTSLG